MILTAKSRNITQSVLHELLTVTAFSDDRLAGKFMAMGVLPGSRVEVMRIAPFKGGYCIKVNGQKIAVRYDEAASILVE